MHRWIRWAALGLACALAKGTSAQGEACPDTARTVLLTLAKDSTAADSFRTVTRALTACGCATRHGLDIDSTCIALRKALPYWSARADSLPGDTAWAFFQALGDWELAQGHYGAGLQAFQAALLRLPEDAATDQRLMRVLAGREAGFVGLHRYDSAYAVRSRIMAVHDRLGEQRMQQALDSLGGRFRDRMAATEDSLSTVRKQALMDQRHADRRAQWLLYAAIGASILALLFLLLFLFRKKKPARIVTVQAPPAKANAGTPDPPSTAPAPLLAPTASAAPVTAGNRISAGIFSAEEFTDDLERLTRMIREGRQVDALAWAQAMGKLGRTMLDRPAQSTVADELTLVRHYLKVEAMRWEDTHFEVTADRALTDANTRIPSLSVLPFVQAAMRLGASRASGDRLLIVHFQPGAPGTECVISANGPAWAAQAAEADAADNAVKELQEARRRFERWGTCTISDLPDGSGTRVLLAFRG
ncbi:MAG: hypothetical protein QM724_06950 [Flavobacteriales bacterium]